MILNRVLALTKKAADKLNAQQNLDGLIVEAPREKEHGDLYTNAAFLLARANRRSPLAMAEALANKLSAEKEVFESVEVKAPGFVNFFLAPELLSDAFNRLLREGTDFLYPQIGNQKKVLIEFVSANPTGPLHIGNGRGGVIGDVLGNLLSKCGYAVEKEYYINDGREGSQMEKLGSSFRARVRESRGEKVLLPEDAYPGKYLLTMAQQLSKEEQTQLLQQTELLPFIDKASQLLVDQQKKCLEDFGIQYDHFISEEELLRQSKVEKVLAEYEKAGCMQKKAGAKWFKATSFGLPKDEVLIRSNGKPTYFLTDIAYHASKFERGYDWLINIWGADHQGHVRRLKTALDKLGYSSKKLTVLLYQLVRLMEQGEPIKMSKRAGEYFTLAELIEEVGKDAARIFFLARDARSPLDFDLSLAKSQNMENPSFYIQYAQCRIRSLYRKKEEMGFTFQRKKLQWNYLQEGEKRLMKLVLFMENANGEAARNLEPHRLYYYLFELASLFHAFYQKNPILSAQPEERERRWALVLGVEKVMLDLFSILGITPQDRM